MTPEGAERAITISALVVAGVYAYRRLTEPPSQQTSGRLAQLSGKGSPPPLGVFITAWGFTFLMLSVAASISPGLGGSMAVLVAIGDVLGNGAQVAKDVNTKIGVPTKQPAKKTP